MSGIVGVWQTDGRPVERAVLATLSAALAHRGPDGEGVWIQGPVGLACRLFRVAPEASAESQPLVHSSGAALVFDGRLDNREEILARLEARAGLLASSPDPALVLAAYEAFGERFPERLAGDFALGLFDPGRRRLVLARDALGVRPLYCCRAPGGFIFASEIKALLAHPRVSTRPNEAALAELLLSGPVPEDPGATFFEGVQSLPPSHTGILTSEGLVVRRYWDFDTTRRIRLGSFGEYAEAFRHHFERAVARRLRSAYPVAVSVSGGLDSSSIFCLARALGRRDRGLAPVLGFSLASADGSPSDEKAYLTEVEREHGVMIERLPIRPTGPLDGAREEVWHVECPLLATEWTTTIHEFQSAIRRSGARVLLSGQWGDNVIFDQAYLIDCVRRLRWRQVWMHLREYRRWLTGVDPRYFTRRFFVDLAKYHAPHPCLPLLRTLKAKLDRATWRRPWYGEALHRRARRPSSSPTFVGRPFATTHASSLYQEARSRYHVQCMEWNNKAAAMHGLEIAFPFLDRDLLSFLMAIPGEVQTWGGVPKALLRQGMRGVLPVAIAERRWKADVTDFVNEGMERDYAGLRECFQPEAMSVKLGYVKAEVGEQLARLAGRIRGPNNLVAWSLRDLIGLEFWLQVFFGEHASQKGVVHGNAG